ncbi:hypothetical protein SAMN05443582_1011100 [Phyllobacterium sp. OV277]|nr:hypothetical protein SAMN05443582_1011100 [Phyllobacterium sp. OV277]
MSSENRRCTVRGSWFDRLTMRDTLVSVILGLDPRTHGKKNQTNVAARAFKLWVLGSSPRMTEMG